MAERTEGSNHIDAQPAEVMAVIVDFKAYPEWAGVKEATVKKQDSKGRAKEVAFFVSQMGFDARYTLVYTYVAKDGGLSWTSKDTSGAVKKVDGQYVLEPPDTGGTDVTYRLALELGISLPGFLRRTAEKTIIGTALDGLKKRVEG
jgi:carbon monoxide dehydrogenase subunit G